MALKLQRFTVTLCAHRFRSKNLVNFFFKPGRASDLPFSIRLLLRNEANRVRIAP